MSKQAAKEWLKKAWHNLSGAKIFYDVDHYTDVIAVELHYAFENKKIPKTHDLYDLYLKVNHIIDLEDYLDLLDKISKYHIEEAYPQYDRKLLSKSEIKDVLEFTKILFENVCNNLHFDQEELK